MRNLNMKPTTTEVRDDEQTARALHELFASATHDASAAMCRWTNGLITVTLDSVQQIALEDVGPAMATGDELLTMVVLTMGGEVGGNLILVFDESNGRQLAASLLGREAGTEAEWTDLEKSVLTETGNILGCVYINTLARLIGADIIPSAPYFVQDYGASVLQQAVMAQAAQQRQLAAVPYRVSPREPETGLAQSCSFPHRG